MHLVVVRVDAAATSERRRRLCLAALLPELDRAGVRDVCLESREAKQNRRDRHLLDALRSQRAINSELHIRHEPGPAEPLLWVPDIVAGAIGALRRGDSHYHEQLADVLTIITI